MKRKVLIIEDDPGITEAIRIAFGFYWPETELVAATHGRQGIEIARRGDIDAVILDLGLPDMDGLDVLEAIRLFSSVPIVVLTASNTKEVVIAAIERKASDYVVKPFSQKDLIRRIRLHLADREGNELSRSHDKPVADADMPQSPPGVPLIFISSTNESVANADMPQSRQKEVKDEAEGADH